MGPPRFHHVVLYRLRPGVTLDRVRAAREALAALVETLPGVVHFVVTDNLAVESGGYTLALISSFEGRAAYEIFARHGEVRRVEDELLAEVVEHRIVAQGVDE
jgi:hypothetical protein